MTAKEAKRLLVMAVVVWDGDRSDLGTVREIGLNGFFVDWECGQRGWIDYEDAEKISVF